MNKPIDVSRVTLKTERLTLRPFRETDVDDFFEYASVDGVGQLAGWTPHKDKSESQEILNIFISGKNQFAVELGGKVIGSVGIEEYSEESLPEIKGFGREIGFVLSKDHWGKGLMPEAVREVIRYLFEEAGLDFIVCAHFIKNTQSARVQEKCGFHFLKNSIRQTRLGTEEPSVENVLYKSEWRKNQR